MSEWPSVPLGDVLADGDGLSYGIVQPGKHVEGGVPIVRVTDLVGGRVSAAAPLRVAPSVDDAHRRTRLRGGELLLSIVGTVGRVSVVPESLAGWNVARAVAVLRAKEPDLVPWLYYVLQSPDLQLAMGIVKTDTVQATLNLRDIRSLTVPLPAPEERRRIVRVLDALNDLIEVDRRVLLDLSNLSDAAFEEWAIGVAELVPLDRTVRRVADGVNSDALGSHTIYLGLEHFGTDAVGLISRGTTDGLGSNKVQFKAGDVLYGKLRPYFRKVARPGFPGVCTTEAWVLRGEAPATQEYVHWIARRDNFTLTAMAGSEGTKMPRANWSHLAKMLVPDPKAPGLDRVSQSVRTFWETACALSQEIEELSAARDELLPLLVSGRVRVADVAA